MNRNEKYRASPGSPRTRIVSPSELSRADITAWAELEDRALEPNAYLSPHFVLPALRFLDPHVVAQVWLVEREHAGTKETIGVGVFQARAWSRRCPLPHYEAYQSRHSYLSGVILDRLHADAALESMLAHARMEPRRRFAIVLPQMQATGEVAQTIGRWAHAHQFVVQAIDLSERAVLVPANAGPEALMRTMGKKANESERCRRKLASMGVVGWRCHRESLSETSIDTFLRLEHNSWKGDAGSSLRSRPADEAFFNAMAHGFAREGRSLFTELSLDDQVIASTANFVSGHAGFAFKVAWDRDLRKLSVGIQNEVELVRRAPQLCSDLHYIDSGAAPGSFIDALWPERRTLATLVIPLGHVGNLGLRCVELAKLAKHQIERITRSLKLPVPPSFRPNARREQK